MDGGCFICTDCESVFARANVEQADVPGEKL